MSGTVQTCVVQELCAVALHPHLLPGADAFFASHRAHGVLPRARRPTGRPTCRDDGPRGCYVTGAWWHAELVLEAVLSGRHPGGGARWSRSVYARAMRRRGPHTSILAASRRR